MAAQTPTLTLVCRRRINTLLHQQQSEDGVASEDGTQDATEDEKHLSRVKDWIISFHLETVNITDILSNFPDISIDLTEAIVDKLVQEGTLFKTKRDTCVILKQKSGDFEYYVKDETDDQVLPVSNRTPQTEGEDYMYIKALLHALPLDYVTAPKLQGKLDGEVNNTTARMLIDRMAREGFVEPTSNRRRVIHSNLAAKKLSEVRKALDIDAMEIDINVSQRNKLKLAELPNTGNNNLAGSTCVGVHSIGSDLTRAVGKTAVLQDGSVRSEHIVHQGMEQQNTPTSKAMPVASRESIFLGNFANNNAHADGADNMTCSRSTQEKRSRKASMVYLLRLHGLLPWSLLMNITDITNSGHLDEKFVLLLDCWSIQRPVICRLIVDSYVYEYDLYCG